MRDARTALVTGLYTQLSAATTTPVHARMPKSSALQYPYIQIGDIYDEENGTKDSFMYDYDVLINIVHKDLSSLTPFYSDIDAVKGTINNNVPFALPAPFRILESTLTSSSTTVFESADGSIINVCAVRVLFKVAQDAV